ncbi:uncharacterized protein N7459_004376 [Penicillium hispanicum]|uniref:uncharacterized protein n=1 Tax=Penicillium hispanicum TaxID=1080232 RepID=UPI0025408730|nr:uncharacterized protein N7459_004376 [Penicillium hispanicum]KAJ5584576.1 hypothetical protein N7459_004376 [Penicillium hispanicum]
MRSLFFPYLSQPISRETVKVAISQVALLNSVEMKEQIIIVDSKEKVRSVLDEIVGFPTKPPSLYLDLEGINLSRHGSLSILTVFVAPTKTAYLVDVHRLGKDAFSTANKDGTSFKSILESPRITKNISRGVWDLQLMELATRAGSKRLVSGLAKCIHGNSDISYGEMLNWQPTKDKGCRLFAPENGGRYEVFNERPLKPELVQYCAQDASLLPGLYDVFTAKLRRLLDARGWQALVYRTTKDRTKESQGPYYEPKGRSKALGPWGMYPIEKTTCVKSVELTSEDERLLEAIEDLNSAFEDALEL